MTSNLIVDLHMATGMIRSGVSGVKSKEVVRTVFTQVLDSVFLITRHLHPDYRLIRVRLNDEKRRFSVSDFLYKPPAFCTTYQRASIPGETMFYAVSCERRDFLSRSQTDFDFGLLIALIETLPELRENCEISGTPDKGLIISPKCAFAHNVSISSWRVQSTINLVEIAPFSLYDMERLRLYSNGFLYESHFRHCPEQAGPTLQFMSAIAREFIKPVSEENEEYFFSALCSNVLCRNHYDGVIYPSVKGNGVGVNVAIKPSAVNSSVRLVGSFDVEVTSDGEKLRVG